MDRLVRFFYFLGILLGVFSFSRLAFATSPVSVKASLPTSVVENSLSPMAFCGNGHIDPGEECDNGAYNGRGNCTVKCQLLPTQSQQSASLAACGNGDLQPDYGEQCDDGNLTNGDGCNSDCKLEFKLQNPNQPVHVQDPSDPSDPNADPTPSDPTSPSDPSQPGPIAQEGNSGSSNNDGSSAASLPSLKGFNSPSQAAENSAGQVMQGGCSLASRQGNVSPFTLGLCALPLFWILVRRLKRKGSCVLGEEIPR